MFRYVRTKSGDIWEYERKLGVYTKPHISVVIQPDDNSIVLRGNTIEEMVMAGDLVNNFIINEHCIGKMDVQDLWTKKPNCPNYYKQYETIRGLL